MRTNPLIRSAFALLFLFGPGLSRLCAQDEISDSEVNQMRKNAQQHLANKQGLKYEIVDVQVNGGQFIVKYDLNEPADAEYAVKMVFLREKDQMFRIVPRTATGAIGEGSFAGKGRTIVWNYKSDYPKELNGDDFYFILDIKRLEPGSTPWVWIGLGGAAVAGGVVFAILGGHGSTSSASSDIPPLTISRPN